MPKRYNTPHRSRVVKTRLSEDEYADFTARLAVGCVILFSHGRDLLSCRMSAAGISGASRKAGFGECLKRLRNKDNNKPKHINNNGNH